MSKISKNNIIVLAATTLVFVLTYYYFIKVSIEEVAKIGVVDYKVYLFEVESLKGILNMAYISALLWGTFSLFINYLKKMLRIALYVGLLLFDLSLSGLTFLSIRPDTTLLAKALIGLALGFITFRLVNTLRFIKQNSIKRL